MRSYGLIYKGEKSDKQRNQKHKYMEVPIIRRREEAGREKCLSET
jgi:hypothetical protein